MNETDIRARLASALADVRALESSLTELMDNLDGQAVQVPRNGGWTRLKVAQLWDESKHLPGVRALFEVAAAHPNEVVTIDDVVRHSGLDVQQQRNEHARMSRVAVRLFGEKVWPIEAWQGQKDGRLQMLYRMGGTVSQWWVEISQDD